MPVSFGRPPGETSKQVTFCSTGWSPCLGYARHPLDQTVSPLHAKLRSGPLQIGLDGAVLDVKLVGQLWNRRASQYAKAYFFFPQRQPDLGSTQLLVEFTLKLVAALCNGFVVSMRSAQGTGRLGMSLQQGQQGL